MPRTGTDSVGAADRGKRQCVAVHAPRVVGAGAAWAAEPASDPVLRALLFERDDALNVESGRVRRPVEVIDVALTGGDAIDRVERAGVDEGDPAWVEVIV
jgi:hypothetical protein